ncbi:MAG TPA: sensor domain-containing diguanylate cyclase [Armatimonadota bacterium]|nr:sensor domain-containing diguanylate cyclase [Armatimonadota bacterium]
MSAVEPGRPPALGRPFTGLAGLSDPPTPTVQVTSVVRLVVLLTVVIMVRLRDPRLAIGPLDLLLGMGGVYVLATTFLPRREPVEGLTRFFLICDIGLISGLVWYTGGTRSEYYLLYYLPILHGAARLNFRDAITTSLLAGLSYVLIAIGTGPMVPVVTTSLLRAGTFGGSVVILAIFFAMLAHEARANRLLNRRLQEALESVSAVYDVARAGSARDSVRDVLDTMLRQATRLSEADSGALAMLDDDGKFQVLARQHAEGAPELDFDEELAREAVERRDSVSREAGQPDAASPVRRVAVPLFVGRSPLAVLQVRSGSPSGLSVHEIELLRAMCAEGGMAIENVRLRAETKRAAAVDYLTGIYNRREFERRLEAEIRRTARHGGQVSLVLLDADDFKHCNDSYGHQAGDQVLQALAGRLEAVIRTEDTAARYGGDEFAIILPQTDISGARAVADKIQRELGALRFGWAADGWQPTVSIGVAASEGELSASLLLQKADRALYEAKDSGRSKVCEWRRGARVVPRHAT